MKKKMETKPANTSEALGSKAPDRSAQSLDRLPDKTETTQDKSCVKVSKVLKLFPSASQKAASNPNKPFSAADKNVAKLSSSTITKAASMPLSENPKSQNISSHSEATTDKEGLKAVILGFFCYSFSVFSLNMMSFHSIIPKSKSFLSLKHFELNMFSTSEHIQLQHHLPCMRHADGA